MEKTEVFRSRYDLWIMVLLAVAIFILWLTAIDMPWWYWIIGPGLFTVMIIVGVFGCWYQIEGPELVIYQFCRPILRLPIMKIRSIKKATGYLATTGCSSRRVSITFSDRKILKSFAPLEISPKDRDRFIAALRKINPSIENLSVS